MALLILANLSRRSDGVITWDVRLMKGMHIALGLLLYLPFGAANAWQWPNQWPGEWSGYADLGYASSSGNSETKHLDAALGLQYASAPWTHSLDLAALEGSESGRTNAQRYEIEAKSKYALSDISYLFGDLIHERDEFGGVKKRSVQTVGYGRELFNTDIHSLEAELGVGARQSELQDGSQEDEAILRLAVDYERQISESAKFDQNLLVEAGQENTYVESISALKLRINGNLYAKLAYTVKHNDSVPAGLENTDTYTSVNLSYEF